MRVKRGIEVTVGRQMTPMAFKASPFSVREVGQPPPITMAVVADNLLSQAVVEVAIEHRERTERGDREVVVIPDI